MIAPSYEQLAALVVAQERIIARLQVLAARSSGAPRSADAPRSDGRQAVPRPGDREETAVVRDVQTD